MVPGRGGGLTARLEDGAESAEDGITEHSPQFPPTVRKKVQGTGNRGTKKPRLVRLPGKILIDNLTCKTRALFRPPCMQ